MLQETRSFADATAVAPRREHARHGGIELLDSAITRARRSRHSSGVEAMVRVTFRYHPALPPRSEMLLVSLPRGPRSRPGALRKRLIGVALELAVLMHRTDRGAALRPL